MADLAFRVSTPEEVTEHDARLRRELLDAAWQQWREHLCEEWGGPHPWTLEIEDSSILISCARGCGASTPDADLTVFMPAIPVAWRIGRDVTPAGPWGPAEVHHVWIEVAPHG